MLEYAFLGLVRFFCFCPKSAETNKWAKCDVWNKEQTDHSEFLRVETPGVSEGVTSEEAAAEHAALLAQWQKLEVISAFTSQTPHFNDVITLVACSAASFAGLYLSRQALPEPCDGHGALLSVAGGTMRE